MIFVMSILTLAASILLKEQDNRLVFSIVSIFMFVVLAFASFNIELIHVTPSSSTAGYDVVTTQVYSPYTAYIFIILFIVSLVNSFSLVLYALRNPENPFDKPMNSEDMM